MTQPDLYHFENIKMTSQANSKFTENTHLRFVFSIQRLTRPVTSFSLLVARGLPRDTENIPVYWKNFTSGLSFTVSILGQHFWSALRSAFATSSSRHQGGYNSKTSLSAYGLSALVLEVKSLSEGNMVEATHVMRKVQPFRVDCTLCRIKQMLVLKNG